MATTTIDNEFVPEPGHEMSTADSVGVFADGDLLQNDARLKEAIEKLDNDARFNPDAIEARMAARAKRNKGKQIADGDETNSSSSSSNSTPAEPVPDVISFGFCKLVFEFLQALKVRFYKRKMIAKTFEMFWQIAERAPAMPYEKFRALIFDVGQERVRAAVAAGDARLEKKMDDLTTKAKTDPLQEQELRRLYAQQTLSLFEERRAKRDALPKDGDNVPVEENAALFEKFESHILRHVMRVPLFRLAKLDKVWCPKLDLTTRDRICQYVERLCKVSDLINNFDPEMKKMINAVSLDSLKAVRGKDKKQIDVNELLDELQERILGNDEFLDKISEIAMKQAQ